MRAPLALAALVLLTAGNGARPRRPPPAADEKAPAWEYSASLYGYFPPEDQHYAQPTVIADHDALHLEARYNYEGLKSGSAWVGWNVGAGEKLRLDATLMVGGVVGDTRGVAPGYELTLSYGRFELYSEGEYVFDTDDSARQFLLQLGAARVLAPRVAEGRPRLAAHAHVPHRARRAARLLRRLRLEEPDAERLRLQSGLGDPDRRQLARRELLGASPYRRPPACGAAPTDSRALRRSSRSSVMSL